MFVLDPVKDPPRNSSHVCEYILVHGCVMRLRYYLPSLAVPGKIPGRIEYVSLLLGQGTFPLHCHRETWRTRSYKQSLSRIYMSKQRFFVFVSLSF